jgi:hypothetical protein
VVTTQIRRLNFAHLAALKSSNSQVENLLKDTAETESELAEARKKVYNEISQQ